MDYLKALQEQTAPSHWALVLRLSELAAERNSPLFLVGGRVRDLILGRASSNLDLVVEGDAPDLTRALARERDGQMVAHSRFGTATYREGDLSIDIATARTEEYSRPGALPDVSPGSIEDDMVRRDFTVNAMALRLSPPGDGELMDRCGGRKDVEGKWIRVLHDGSFVDDPTRIMRAIRYEQRFGFRIESHTASLLARDLCLLPNVGVDRVRRELELFLSEPTPELPLLRAEELGVLKVINPGLKCHTHVAGMFRSARERWPGVEPGVYLALLLWSEETNWAFEFLQMYRFPKESIQTVKQALALRDAEKRIGVAGLRGSEVHALFKGYTRASIRCFNIAASTPEARAHATDYLERIMHIGTELSGRDLMDLGVPRGPGIGEVLRKLLDARLDGLVGTREEEEGLVKQWLRETRG